jgi:hypothetical protein
MTYFTYRKNFIGENLEFGADTDKRKSAQGQHTQVNLILGNFRLAGEPIQKVDGHLAHDNTGAVHDFQAFDEKRVTSGGEVMGQNRAHSNRVECAK